MAMQYGVANRNAQLDALETAVGTSPKLRFYSGSMPANAGTAASGTMLAELTLPSDWMAAASSGSKAKSGTWSGTGDAGASTGTNIGYFRIYDSAGSVCHVQGTVTVTGGGGDMTLDNISIASAQAIAVSTFSITGGNA
jgi:hypothetical protein